VGQNEQPPENFSIKIDPKLSKLGSTESRCPICSYIFPEFPKSKKKCPGCKTELFIRKRPIDNAPTILTLELLPQLEVELLAKIASNRMKHLPFSLNEQYQMYTRIKNELTIQFGFPAKNNDIVWRLLNEQFNNSVMNGGFIAAGLYLLHMGTFLESEQKNEQALRFYLQTCYLDLTMGCPISGPPYTIKNVNEQYIRPAVFDYIIRMKKILPITRKDCGRLYSEAGKLIFEQMENIGLECTPSQSWPIIEQIFSERKIFE